MRRSLVLAALLLAGCGHHVTAGYVDSKRLDPAHEETRFRAMYMGETCSKIGKTTSCTPHYIYVPYQVDVPDLCYVTLKDEEGASEYSVSCSTYPSMAVGSRMTAP